MGHPPNPGSDVRAATLTALANLHAAIPGGAPYMIEEIYRNACVHQPFARTKLDTVKIGYALKRLTRTGHVAKTWSPDGQVPLYTLTPYGFTATAPRYVGPPEKHGTAPL